MFEETVSLVRELFREPEGFIPLHEPYFAGNEEAYVVDTVRSTFVSSVGAYVDRFETELASFIGGGKAVATASGSSALHVALILAGADRETEVLTQALTFVATGNAILYSGAIPVFLDVDRDSMGLSPEALANFLEKETEKDSGGYCINRRTRRRIVACVPMHTFGFPARIEGIAKLCEENGIVLVEDAAESIGSLVGATHTGRFGSLGVFSFNGNKTITAGGGGAVVTGDDELARRAKHLTTTAKVPHAWRYWHDTMGFNYRMPNLNAALACAQLEKLPAILERKRHLAKQYTAFFDQQGVEYPCERAGTTANFWLNTVMLADKSERDAFLEFTNARKVMTRPAWEPLNELPMFDKCQTDHLETTRYLADRLVNLPSSVPRL